MAMMILGAGCITPIGLGLAETAAAARARVARLREISLNDRRGEPVVAGSVPDDALPPLADPLQDLPLQSREARMLRLAHVALAEALETLPADTAPLPLLLGLPEHHALRAIEPAAFLRHLLLQSGAAIDLSRSVAVARGRAAGLMALRQAAMFIEAGQTGHVLVGGVDSLLDPYVLDTFDLQGRLRSESNGEGFRPGEGAAFLLLGKADGKRDGAALARIEGAGMAVEAGHLYAEAPYLGEGLAAAVTGLFGEQPPPSPIACTYSSFNGERYWAREFGVARIRNAAHFSDAMQLEHPAECCGDLGAAHGPLLAALAAHGLAGGYRPGPCLVYASSDHGDRAAALLTRAG